MPDPTAPTTPPQDSAPDQTTKEDLATEALAAMEEGIASVTPDALATPDASVTPALEDSAPDTQVQGEAAPAPDDAQGVQPADEAAQAEAARAEAAKEAASLGLGHKASERFHQLTDQVKQLAPYREALEKIGIKDPAQIPALVDRAKIGEDMVKMVTDTGATAEDYGATLDFLGLMGQVRQGDRAAAEKAYEMVQGQVTELAKFLGKEVPGVHDPLQDHADLAEAVDAGDITRKHALELAAARAQQQAQQQRQQLEMQTQAGAQEQAQAIGWLQQYDAQMVAADPTYAAKRPILDALVKNIRATLPPAQWPQAVQSAYASIPAISTAPAPAAAPSKPPPGPMRPGGPRPTMIPQFDDPMEALNFGLSQVG